MLFNLYALRREKITNCAKLNWSSQGEIAPDTC